MKKLSVKNTLYLLLFPRVLSLFEAIFFSAVYGIEAIDSAQDSFVLKIINSTLVIAVYYILSTINTKFKKFFVCNIIYISLDWMLLILNELSAILYLTYLIYDILLLIKIILNVPCVYFFYRGFYDLTNDVLKKKIANAWKILGGLNIVVASLSVLKFISLSFHSIRSFVFDIYLLNMLFNLFLPLMLLCIGVLDFVYIVKTARIFKEKK